MNTLFLEPLDVLYLRGNKNFGAAGEHGEALMPPWPTMAAGAIRSRLMAEGHALERLANFRLSRFCLARKNGAKVEMLYPLPADVVVITEEGEQNALRLYPNALPEGIKSSYALPQVPCLATQKPAKPMGGFWLNEAGFDAWAKGGEITEAHLIKSATLWTTDPRLGIAIDTKTGSAAEGKIYTSDTIALHKNVGFIATYEGVDAALPENALLRLGGDGRGAKVHSVPSVPIAQPAIDWDRIAREKRCRLLLTTPGIFEKGWMPQGVPARLVAASVARSETLSGWDLITGKPKDACRIAPVGSIYWLDEITDLEALKNLVKTGLPTSDKARYAEGFNQAYVAPFCVKSA